MALMRRILAVHNKAEIDQPLPSARVDCEAWIIMQMDTILTAIRPMQAKPKEFCVLLASSLPVDKIVNRIAQRPERPMWTRKRSVENLRSSGSQNKCPCIHSFSNMYECYPDSSRVSGTIAKPVTKQRLPSQAKLPLKLERKQQLPSRRILQPKTSIMFAFLRYFYCL